MLEGVPWSRRAKFRASGLGQASGGGGGGGGGKTLNSKQYALNLKLSTLNPKP